MASGADVLNGSGGLNNPSASSAQATFNSMDPTANVHKPISTFEDFFKGNWLDRQSLYESQVNESMYNHAAQMAQWEREDNAYQRTVADMKKAGLNPYWMAASGSVSGAATSTSGSSVGKNPAAPGNTLQSLISLLGAIALGAFGLAGSSVRASATTGAAALRSAPTSSLTKIFDKNAGLIQTVKRVSRKL